MHVWQAFFNKSLLEVLNHIITPYATTSLEEEEEELLLAAVARGGSPIPASKRPPVYIENKHVVQMRVPKPYVDREYRVRHCRACCIATACGAGCALPVSVFVLVRYGLANGYVVPHHPCSGTVAHGCDVRQMLWMELVLTRGELPIALYRCCEVGLAVACFGSCSRQISPLVLSLQAKNSPLPYVIANPRPSTRLHAGDRVFVLCGESLLAEAARSSSAAHARAVASGVGVRGEGAPQSYAPPPPPHTAPNHQ